MTETDRRFADQSDDLSKRARWTTDSTGSTDSMDSEDSADPVQDEDVAADDDTAFATDSASDAAYAANTDADTDRDTDADLDTDTDLNADPDLNRNADLNTSTDTDTGLRTGTDADTGLGTTTPVTARASSPASASIPASTPIAGNHSAESDSEPLLPEADADQLRVRWQSVQAGFVDDPRNSVQEADGLLEQVAERFAQSLTDARSALRSSWDSNSGTNGTVGTAADDAGTSTEQLRGTLQDYRRLVNRLLDV